jgi:hypothetical protein
MAQLEDSNGGPAPELETAWRRLEEVITALSPAVTEPETSQVRIGPVAGRLVMVMAFLLFQLIVAAALLGWVVLSFGRSDPQTTLTREQWEERAGAIAEIGHVQLVAEEAARAASAGGGQTAATPPSASTDTLVDQLLGPDASALRATVEGLVATLTGMRLAERDLRLANRYLDNVLVALDEPDFAEAARLLAALNGALAGDPRDAPASPIPLILMGSVLGMLTITIHLNWKFRNRWDTVGFLPWYVTRLIAAPVISLAALGLLFQVSFTTDLTTAAEITALGLRGASPLTIFAVAVISGLFSNRVYDWLRGLLAASSSPRPTRPGAMATPPPATDEP